MPNQNDQPDEVTGGPLLVEFVDAAHEVTEEERNRPRYGRPVRKPADTPGADSVQTDPPPAAK